MVVRHAERQVAGRFRKQGKTQRRVAGSRVAQFIETSDVLQEGIGLGEILLRAAAEDGDQRRRAGSAVA